jgi:arsenical pump membrane protein
MSFDLHLAATWLISLASIGCVLARPKAAPEAAWAVGGAALLVIFRLVEPAAALSAVKQGTDVYLFLAGMMLLSELARHEGVFDWLAVHAVRCARRSRSRLFLLIYAVGSIVTVLLSNDATAVVLTPAVQAAVGAAGVEPLPYLLACAFIANAASFVLPISNPANLVVFHGSMPPLGRWLEAFLLPSIVSIVATFAALRWAARCELRGAVRTRLDDLGLTPAGRATLWSIAAFAAVMLAASFLGLDLGLPAFLTGLAATLAVVVLGRSGWKAARSVALGVSWSVLPLVAGLFVVVEALRHAGAAALARQALDTLRNWPPVAGALAASFGVAAISNLMNNLPSGLIAGEAVRSAHAAGPLRDAVLVGVDLGPNFSVTGSLATILWLIALRRNGEEVSFGKFLRYGLLVTPLALALATLALLIGWWTLAGTNYPR